MQSVDLPIMSGGTRTGTLRISTLRKSLPGDIWDATLDSGRDESVEAIQLIESTEYLYQLDVASASDVSLDPEEIFQGDNREGRRGRLKTGLYTGSVTATVLTDAGYLGECAFEVRSRKLDYQTEYRAMLRDLTRELAEVIQEGFAPSHTSFIPLGSGNAVTAYQRFAFLRSILQDDEFVAAIHHVLEHPYVSWEEFTEHKPFGAGIRGGSYLGKALSAPGPRFETRGLGAAVHSVPKRVLTMRHEETTDNAPNQFVQHVFRHWRHEVASILDALRAAKLSPTVRRGIRECSVVSAELDELLSAALFRGVTTLTRLPLENQTLHKREGYREILTGFLEYDLASRVEWSGSSEVFGAGSRNVAALYEYWVFIQIACILARICGDTFRLNDLISHNGNGLHLHMKKGQHTRILGTVERNGVPIQIELWYNRQFSRPAESWSTTMIPDCSILFRPKSAIATARDEVWLHFDAKYRLEALKDIFQEPVSSEAEESTRARRDDLLKMHAYRDAIHRTAGSYVVYPGSQDERLTEYHELLPGLGAFALRPTSDGPVGVDGIETFLNDVLDHLSSEFTQRRRARYWNTRVFERGPVFIPARTETRLPLRQPPADTLLLLGYVRSQAHFAWVTKEMRYNVRAGQRRGAIGLDSDELGAELLLTYGSDVDTTVFRIAGPAELWTLSEMAESGYPDPRGNLYFCFPLQSTVDVLALSFERLESVITARWPRALRGAPHSLSWSELNALLSSAR